MSDIKNHQMYETGGTLLSNGEFHAAANAFKNVLENDPHDFLALRGLLLASAHLADMEELFREDNRKGFAYNANLINDAIKNSSEEDREYFNEFGRIFSDKKRLYDLNNEIKSLKEDKKNLEAKITLHNEERTFYYVMNRRGRKKDPKATFIPLVIAGGYMILSGLFWFIMESGLDNDWLLQGLGWFCLILGIILVVCSFIFIFPKILEVKDIDKYCNELKTELMQVETKIKGLEYEADNLSDHIRTSSSIFLSKDRLKTSSKS